jgi:ABC-type oligopeptide transport system substrate-binding subunit
MRASLAEAAQARYGAGRPAARSGRQQYFVNAARTLDIFALNTHRPVFADARLRRAVNYALDRTVLARFGSGPFPLPDRPIDHYLPPGIPGYRGVDLYPDHPDLVTARRLARGHAGESVVLYTCDFSNCVEQAQIVKNDLARIGLQVEIKALPWRPLWARVARPGEPFDMVWADWIADYPDPDQFLNFWLESGTLIPSFDDPTYRRRLTAAARLSGPARYLAYARLDTDLARHGAPWVAYGSSYSHELFSPRMGCQTYGVYGIDLAALYIRGHSS